MYKYLVLGALLWATPVMASEKPSGAPTDPSCGKTVQDCQKIVDAQGVSLGQLGAAYSGLLQQRDTAQKSYLDLQLQMYVKEITSKKTP